MSTGESVPSNDRVHRYPDDDELYWQEDGDCPSCDGTGEVCCNCDDHGCSRCIDGMRMCESCQGSGFMDREPYCDDY